jgi:hypothetical protein
LADPPSYTGDDTDVGPDRRSATSRSRWVPVIGIVIAVVLVLLVVVLHITGVLGPGAH